MNSIPHLAVFLDVPDADNPAAVPNYARRFFAPFKRDNNVSIDGFDGLKRIDLPLVDREATMRTLSKAAVDRLQDQERCLLGQVAKAKDLPPGEKLSTSYCGVLQAAHGPCPAGTVVVIRKTDVATVAFLYPHLRVDITTGAVTEVANPLPSRTSDMRTAVIAAPSLTALGGSDDVPEWIHYGLETAATLAFGLPEPWGVIGSAVLSLIDMLLGKGQNDPFKDLGKMMDNRDWGLWMQYTASLVKWIEQNNELLRQKGNYPDASTVEEEVLKPLNSNLTPGKDSLFSILFEIANQPRLIDDRQRFYALMTCITSYLFAVKTKIILCAYISSEMNKAGDEAGFNHWNNRWRFDYDFWVLEILGGTNTEGWVPKITNLIQDRINARLIKIHPPERYDEHSVSYPPPNSDPSNTPVITDIHMWHWWDDETGESHRYDDEHPKNAPTIKHEADARRDHEAHVKKVSGELDALYKDAKQMVAQWRDSINQWNEHLPPGFPQGRLSIDPNSFRKTTPADGPWADANNSSVSYAVSFYNEKSRKGPGPISDWEKADINGQCCPTLVNVPVDSFKMALGRRIYRKFGASKERLIGTIPDNTSTTYKDNDVVKK